MAHADRAADRALGPRRQSRRAGAPACREAQQQVRQAIHCREHAGRRRHPRRQYGGQGAARRARAGVRRFRQYGHQPGAQSKSRLRPDQGLRAGDRPGQSADHHVRQSQRAGQHARRIHRAGQEAAGQNELRLGRRWLDPPSHHGDLRRADRHRTPARALSRRLSDGERAPDRRDPGRLVRHTQRH